MEQYKRHSRRQPAVIHNIFLNYNLYEFFYRSFDEPPSF